MQSCEQSNTCQTTSTNSHGQPEDMRAMLRRGMTLREIGKAHGVSHVTVKNRLEAMGVEMNAKGRKPIVLTADELAKPAGELSKKYGVSKSAIHAAKRRQAPKGASNA